LHLNCKCCCFLNIYKYLRTYSKYSANCKTNNQSKFLYFLFRYLELLEDDELLGNLNYLIEKTQRNKTFSVVPNWEIVNLTDEELTAKLPVCFHVKNNFKRIF
jgi:hypothetical protein